MSSMQFGTRPGEKTIDLPDKTDAGIYFIGRIHTPWQTRDDCPKNPRGSDAVCTVALDERYVEALKDVETCTHLVLLYWMDKAPRNLTVQVPGHMRGEQHGTFALRSPARPNPIAMSVVRLVGVTGNELSVVGLDCLDGTPLLDIKPYLSTVDSVPDAVCGWRQKKA